MRSTKPIPMIITATRTDTDTATGMVIEFGAGVPVEEGAHASFFLKDENSSSKIITVGRMLLIIRSQNGY